MALSDILEPFRAQDHGKDPLKARWYIVAIAALAAASASEDTPELYRLCTDGLPLEKEKLVQRRVKEAVLKTSMLYGVPKALQALYPMFNSWTDEQIDTYGPRSEAVRAGADSKIREARGQHYFDVTWTPAIAQANQEKNRKYHPDFSLLNQQMLYEWWVSEDAILSNVETQMCTTAALVCSNSPVQALWHTRGIIRHGGSMADAKFAQDLGLAIARAYDCKTGEITRVEDIDFSDITPP
ncbi:uncharacterized protein LTHEOB_8708 [Lasiodiplodia theobromae]|uniref:uncharacterized protein n=1 Tax=Lasiodiplodia theobromae TaxID=45133 RepID=UPI0015C3C6C7|nr:uncharacterized protein LTHEOB_8708 [Lasiodiplodia theobromae]KAF4541312.1 hypothetical protein LTHEOB_8708 [Lasiodiplodia theobromae]